MVEGWVSPFLAMGETHSFRLYTVSSKLFRVIYVLHEPSLAMSASNILDIVWLISAIGLVIFILLHSPKGDGIGGIGGQAQLFTSTKSAETALNRITWGLFTVFILLRN